ncbi:MAG: hypothetical protein HY902_04685, partial [Deltaproteobacteria bacterium]|nr:hypothetical protein [Deltaproteobacteria bacterium]
AAAVTNTFKAFMTPDIGATYDFDKDGTADSLNVGCETCHGPGSRHMANQGKGLYIVTPQNLSPDRENMLCGQCHSRVAGAGAGKTEAPLDAAGNMALPGVRRADWLKNNVSVIDDGIHAVAAAAADGTFTSVGDGKHSVKHHQQYSEFIKSTHYRNGKQLLVCTDCHNVHSTKNTAQLKEDPTTTAVCAKCHADYGSQTGLDAHVKAKTAMPAALGATCMDCHMVKTALSGAGTPAAKGFYQNDISSHIFDVPAKALIKNIDPAAAKGPLGKVMPIPYTNACGTACHKFPVL